MTHKIYSLIFIILLLVLIAGSFHYGSIAGYKNGQIDAINGEIHYQLIKQSDNSTSWCLIKKDNN